MKYDIISFNDKTAEIVVKPELLEPISIILPVDKDGLVPTGDNLHSYILGFIPIANLSRIDKLKYGLANAAEIHKLVDKSTENTLSNPIIKNEIKLTISQKMEAILVERDKRLTASDWTQLEDVVAYKGTEWAAIWAKYRQALRDMTETITNIDKNQFPIPPIE